MATIQLPNDFKEFLKLLNANDVEYLLIGGFAVGFYGYPRPTGDMDLWVAMNPANAARLVAAYREFGFDVPNLREELFLKDDQIIRIGLPPYRIEVMTTISGVDFDQCFQNRTIADIDGVPTAIISLDDLKANKAASNRHKDLDDLENLP